MRTTIKARKTRRTKKSNGKQPKIEIKDAHDHEHKEENAAQLGWLVRIKQSSESVTSCSFSRTTADAHQLPPEALGTRSETNLWTEGLSTARRYLYIYIYGPYMLE